MRKFNKRGFTLAELLIVVAIIAVLVAVSIPVFTTQLEKSREETDMANLRSAYAIVQTSALTDDYKKGGSSDYTPTDKWNKTTTSTTGDSVFYSFYNVKRGELQSSDSNDTKGKGTLSEGGAETYGGPIYYNRKTAASQDSLVVYIKDTNGVAIDTGVGFVAKDKVSGLTNAASISDKYDTPSVTD